MGSVVDFVLHFVLHSQPKPCYTKPKLWFFCEYIYRRKPHKIRAFQQIPVFARKFQIMLQTGSNPVAPIKKALKNQGFLFFVLHFVLHSSSKWAFAMLEYSMVLSERACLYTAFRTPSFPQPPRCMMYTSGTPSAC